MASIVAPEVKAEDDVATRRLEELLGYVEQLIKLDEHPATRLSQHKLADGSQFILHQHELSGLRVGWTPISSEATTCGVLTGFAFPCEILRFGFYNNNQLDVYLAPRPDGVAVVNSWSIHKS